MLKPVSDQYNFFDLLLTANMNLTSAIGYARDAAVSVTGRTPAEREQIRQRAKDEIECLAAHFMAALDLIPTEPAVSSPPSE